MTLQRDLMTALMLALVLGAGRAVWADEHDISQVSGSITIGPGEHAGDLATVNGSVQVGDNAVVGHAHSVNGSIKLLDHASASELKTVNGSIRLHEGARVSGPVGTVNGSLILDKGADVGDRLSNVNGSIRVSDAHVAGDIDTVTGSIEVGPNARVDGGIHVHKDQSDGGGTIDEPRVVIGPGSVVKGTLKFERPVKLYVSDHATTGAVEGATVIAFTGDRPRGE